MLRKVIAPKGRIPSTANRAQLTYLVMTLLVMVALVVVVSLVMMLAMVMMVSLTHYDGLGAL